MIIQPTIGHAYHALARCRDTFVLVESNRGAGKTRAILSLILARALAWPGTRWGLFRSTRTRLSETILTTLEQQVFPAHGMPVPGMAGAVNRTSYDLPNGSKLLPIGLDDIQRSTSLELAGGYLAEAVELDDEQQAQALAGCLRQEGAEFHQLIVDTNPGPRSHWLNLIAEPVSDTLRRVNTVDEYRRLQRHNQAPASQPRRWKRIVARHQDNPGYFDAAAWKWTEQGQGYLRTLDSLSGHLRARWLDGIWATAQGAVFPTFDRSRHAIQSFPLPASWPAVLSEDPGFDHPTAIAVAVVAPNGRLYFVGECVRSETTVAQDAEWITQHQRSRPYIIRRKLGDPHYMFSANKHNNGVTVAQQMRKLGHHFEPAPAATNGADLDAQVQMIRTGLDTNLSDGKPAVQFFEDACPMLINAMESHPFKRNTKGERTGAQDQYSEQFKDEIDAVRMIVASKPRFEGQQFKSS